MRGSSPRMTGINERTSSNTAKAPPMRRKMKPITCLAVPFAAGILVAAAISFPVISAPAPDSKVEIDNFAFSPGRITVKAGTTVTWLNADDTPHTVASSSKLFKSKALDTDGQLLVHVHHARRVRSMLIERSKSRGLGR